MALDKRTLGTAIVILLVVIGALSVIGFVVRALRWLLIVAVVVAVLGLISGIAARRGGD
jgi:hypothetical protein